MIKPGFRRSVLGRVFASLVVSGLVTIPAMGCNDDSFKSAKLGKIEVVPAKFTFSKQAIGGPAQLSQVKVKNIGEGTLKLTDFTPRYSGDFQLRWVIESGEGGGEATAGDLPKVISIEPDSALRLDLYYAPSDTLGASGRVTFRTNDPTSEHVTIPIEAGKGGPELHVSPSSISFPRVPAGTIGCEPLQVNNLGTSPLFLEEVALNGSADFSLLVDGHDMNSDEGRAFLQDPDGDGEPGLAPGASFSAEVCYSPEAEGNDSGELIFVTNAINGASQTIPISANSAAPCISVSPDVVDFGSGIIGRSTPKPVTLTSCGSEALEVEHAYINEANGTEVFSLDADNREMPFVLPGATADNRPSEIFVVNFAPTDEVAYAGELIVESNDEVRPSVAVPLNGRGLASSCPMPGVVNDEFSVVPLDVVTLDASPSINQDGEALTYEWVVVQRPDGSTAEPVERFRNPQRPADGGTADDPATPTAHFFVDLAGEYLIELRVTNTMGLTTPSEECPEPVVRVRIISVPDQDVHIQLVWDTPGDPNQTDSDGTDVDLHLVHPNARAWASSAGGLDCYYGNKNPDWGPAGPPGNPSLDIDDVDGAGPENINIRQPEDTGVLGAPYRVGIHYWRAEAFGFGSFGPSTATVRIFLGGSLALETSRVLQATDHFWEVAGIEWGSNGYRTVDINRYYTSHP